MAPFSGKRLHLIQFAGPVRPEWYAALEATGVDVVAYIPEDGYLIYGDLRSLGAVRSLRGSCPFLSWDGEYGERFKLSSTPGGASSGQAEDGASPSLFAIQLIKDPQANAATLALLDRNRTGPIQSQFGILNYLDLVAPLPAAFLPALAARPDVVAVQPYSAPVMNDERQDQIIAGNLAGSAPAGPGYLGWLLGKGFTQAQFAASGFAVDVSDSGVDSGTTTPTHFGLYQGGVIPGTSRVAYSRLVGTPNVGSTLEGCDGHGTINAHIVAGYDDSGGFPFADASGFHYGLGVCPFVNAGASVVFDPAWTFPSYPNIQSQAYRDGARMSTNSWGFDAPFGTYDINAQAYDALVRDAQPAGSAVPADGNQEMVILFSAGNKGPSATTIGRPGTAKNVLTVGAAQNVQPFGGADGCSIDDTQAGDAGGIATFSSRGPCSDGRMKPDLVAPGTHVSGGVFQMASPPANGQADPCFNGIHVCGGPAASLYWPLGQQWYTASSGTSHACPAVAGAAALLRQFFLNQSLPAPSPAMTKAYLMNSARYLTGPGANDTLWSGNQGMGEVDLGTAFDGTPRMLRDELSGDTFTTTGTSLTFTGAYADPARPFRVTLAWTDAPGSIVSSVALVNDLDLTVTAGGNTYKGNVFAGAQSSTGGTVDNRNNVESAFLPPGLTGPFAVTVKASNIAGVGVPNPAGTPNQDFALVIYNGVESPSPVIATDGASLTSETCSPPNGYVDPGETVTVGFWLRNVGVIDSTNLVATLRHSGGVVPITFSQSYGALAVGGASLAQPFTFLANGACGGTITAILDLHDGALSLGSVSFTLPLGTPTGCCRGAGPRPVPDSYWVPGTAMTASRVSADGSTVHLTWDVTTCPASSYNVYSGPLSSVATYGYDNWACSIATAGASDVPLGSGDQFFVVVPVEGSVEGSHGRDSLGRERSGTGAGHCLITSKDPSGVCP